MQVAIVRGIRVFLDVAVLVLAFLAAWFLRFEGGLTGDQLNQALVLLPSVVGLKYLLLRRFRVHRHSWQHVSLAEVLAITQAVGVAALALVVVRLSSGMLVGTLPSADYGIVPFGVIGIDLALSVIGLLATRASRRLQVQRREVSRRSGEREGGTEPRGALLVGTGRAGATVAREMRMRPDAGLRPVGFLDTDPRATGQLIEGVPVLGTLDELPSIAAGDDIDEVVVTAQHHAIDVRRIVDACEAVGVEVKIIPQIHELVGGQVSLSRLRPVSLEDLLRRDPVELDIGAIRSFVTGEVVAVTGAGGSIGAELARQLGRFAPRRLLLLERSEPALWTIDRDLRRRFPDVEVVACIADVCDRARVEALLGRHRPSSLFHAAAHKHVPLMEDNVGEAVKNNLLGTSVVADAAERAGTDRFVLVSTDKAVNPSSVMGATKRLAERYVHHVAHRSGRVFVSVRFGNVLGSTGSVVPVFEEQIEQGGPVTVTHPEMRRYFMTIPEASQLVLQAASMGTGGEVFTLDMGEPVRIVDLATDLIRLSGLTPGEDIPIEFTGARPGEKLFEELSLSEETADRTAHDKVWVARHAVASWPDAHDDLAALADLADVADEDRLRARLRTLVPEFVEPVPVGDTGELPLRPAHVEAPTSP